MSGSDLIRHPAIGSDRSRSDVPRRGLSLTGLAGRQLRRQGGWSSALALGLAAAMALASAVPLAGAMAADAALQSAVAGLGRQAPVTVAKQHVADPSAFESFEAQATQVVEGRLGRYLDVSRALATLGPLTLVSVNENPASAQVESKGLSAGYLRDLPDRVELVAGSWPPDGLGGSTDVATSMAQSGADALGLHLGDRLCADFAPGGVREGRWCARIAALWRPQSGADPLPLESANQGRLLVGRYDFYHLMKLASSPLATVGRQFFLDPGTVDARNAGDLVSGLRDLRRHFASRGELFDTSLDQAINSFQQAQRPVRLASELLSASLLVLLLYAVNLVGAQFLRLQSRESSLLIARGWPRRKIRSLLLRQIAFVVLGSLTLGAALTISLTAALGPAAFGAQPPWPDATDRIGLLLAAGGVVAGLLAVWTILARLSAAAASPRSGPDRQGDAEPRPSPPRRPNPGLLLLLPAFALLAAARWLQGLEPFASLPPPLAAGSQADWLSVVASLAATLLLVLVSVWFLRLTGRLAPGASADVPGRLAAWQLGRRPQQHAAVAFLVAFAASAATFGGVAAGLGFEQGREPLVLAVVAAGTLAVLVITLLGFGVHFRATAGERAEEYAALVLSGLPARDLRRSLALEQRAVIWQSLASGALLGVVLAAALLPLDQLRTHAAIEAAAAGCVLLGFLAAVLLTAWGTRAWLGRLDARRQLRVLV